MKVIGIIGTRRRDGINDYIAVLNQFIKIYEPGDAICSGLCPQGGDRFAVIIADILKLPDDKRIWFPADWNNLKAPGARIKRNKYGPYNANAGFIRNTDIARSSDILIACVAQDRKGGTEDTISKFAAFHGIDNLLIV